MSDEKKPGDCDLGSWPLSEKVGVSPEVYKQVFGETSKPADLLDYEAERAYFIWRAGNAKFRPNGSVDEISTAVAYAKSQVAAHISEVERVTKERDAEIRAWQDAIYKVCIKAAVEAGFPDYTIDGGGSDGDELAFTLAEIGQAINCVQEAAESKLSQLQLSNEDKARKIAVAFVSHISDQSLAKKVESGILAILNGGQS